MSEMTEESAYIEAQRAEINLSHREELLMRRTFSYALQMGMQRGYAMGDKGRLDIITAALGLNPKKVEA